MKAPVLPLAALSRRNFLRITGAGGATLALLPWPGSGQDEAAEIPSLFTREEVQSYQPKGASACFRHLCYDYNWVGRTLADLPLKFTEADPVVLADFSQRCNVDAILLLAVPHHGFTTYPSRAGTEFSALKGKDWYGACIKELHRRNISVFGYITIGFNWKYARDHRGQPFIHCKFAPDGKADGLICLNAPGFIQLLEDYTREVLTRYPVDALRYDILGSSKRCLCDGCQAYYKELYGEALTSWDKVDERRGLDFYLATLDRPVNHLTKVARSIKPSVQLWQNGINTYSEVDLNLGRQLDLAYVEFGDPIRLLALRGILNKSAIIVGQTLNLPIRREIMALGARCYQYVPVDQKTILPKDQAWCLRSLAPFFKMVGEVEPYLRQTTLPTHLGIVFSENTRRRYAGFNREPYMKVCEKIAADYLKSSLPVAWLNCLDLAGTGLSQFKALVLPETSGLTAAQLDSLRRYVEGGGKLLVAGGALLADEQGLPLQEFQLSRELGVQFKDRMTNTHPEGSIEPDPSWKHVLPLTKISATNLYRVNPVAGATLLQLRLGADSVPLLHVNDLGQGQVAYLATTDSEPLLRAALDALAGPAPLAVTPAGKRVVLTRQETQKRWVLHLLSEGDYQVDLRSDFVRPRRVVEKYPAENWEAELTATPTGVRIAVQGQAPDRLLTLD